MTSTRESLCCRHDEFDEYSSRHYIIPSDATVKEIRRSAEQGCPGCILVINVVDAYVPHVHKYDIISARYAGYGLSYPNSWYLQIASPKNRGNTYANVEIYIFKEALCASYKTKIMKSISGNTGSDAAVARVQSWLRNCVAMHDPCNSNLASALPDRILQIDGPEQVRLYLSTNEMFPYVCLSHCWGNQEILKTKSGNLDDYKTGIPWSKLPKTFQDAISFAYRLGFKYVWIDSLCILQDSADDWHRQGSKMGDIYENAALTISATASANPKVGCFKVSNSVHEFRTFSSMDKSGNLYTIHARLPLPHEQFKTNNLPLMKRGWCLQERILSRRTVHFTTDELIWECREHITCECSLICPSPIEDQRGKIHSNFGPIFWRSGAPVGDIRTQWHKIISWYSSSALTFEKDYFPALQGLAKRVPPSMGEYLAGLWSTTLLTDLTWVADPYLSAPNRPAIWRAPTWSWASTTARPILFDRKLLRADLVVTRANIVPRGGDPTGELESAELVLKCRIFKASVLHLEHVAPWTLSHQILTMSSAALAFRQDGKNWLFTPRKWGPRCLWDYKIESPGSHFVSHGEGVFLMRISGKRNLCHSTWMIMRPSPQRISTFERIGLFEMSPGTHKLADFWKMEDGQSDELVEYRCYEFLLQGGDFDLCHVLELSKALDRAYDTSPEVEITLV